MITAISSVYAHNRKGAVDWEIFKALTPWILLGTVAGTIIVDRMPGEILYVAFILFLYAAATRLAIGNVVGHHKLPGTPGMAICWHYQRYGVCHDGYWRRCHQRAFFNLLLSTH